MSNKDEIKDKPVEGPLKVKPEEVITDDLKVKTVQEKADEAAAKAGKVTG